MFFRAVHQGFHLCKAFRLGQSFQAVPFRHGDLAQPFHGSTINLKRIFDSTLKTRIHMVQFYLSDGIIHIAYLLEITSLLMYIYYNISHSVIQQKPIICSSI